MTPPNIPVDDERLVRWTYDEFVAMAEAGLFEQRRLELIAGKITRMSPVSAPHSAAVSILHDDWSALLKGRAWIRSQDPIDLAAIASMPQPDVVVCDLRPDRYAYGLPKPDQVRLLVEVAQSSLSFDRTTKRKLYASAGIREYWILNLVDRQLECFASAEGGDYPEPIVYDEGERFDHDLLGGVTVADLLPMAPPEALS